MIEYKYPPKYSKVFDPPKDEPFFSPHLAKQSIETKDGVHISPMISTGLAEQHSLTCLLELGCRISKTRQCLGRRKSVEEEYSWLTYEQVDTMVQQFGSALHHVVGHVEGEDNILGIYGRNSPQWVCGLFGSVSYSYIFVPIYDTLGPEAMQHILNQTKLSVILCHAFKQADFILRSFQSSIVCVIIIEDSSEARALIQSHKASVSQKIYLFDEFLKIGQEHRIPKRPLKPEDLCTLCYTSGSTGIPKGVMLRGIQYASCIRGVMSSIGWKFYSEKSSHVSFLPLAHIMEQLLTIATISTGGRIGYLTTGIDSLTDDCQRLQPTVLPAVPRLISTFYRKFLDKFPKSKVMHKMLRRHMSKTLRHQARGRYEKANLTSKLFFGKLRKALGDRICCVICGGAPLNGDLLRFSRVAFNCPVVEGYGQTETTGVISVTLIGESAVEVAGSLVPNLEVKLCGVPDMGIDPASTGVGEICVRGVQCTSGYYRDEENTSKLFHPGGWLRTGDVGQWHKNGQLKVVDRVKFIFKLSQGEYIAPEKVEGVYQLSELVQFCLLDGKSSESYCVVIVVPFMDILNKELVAAGLNGTSVENGTSHVKTQRLQSNASTAGMLESKAVREFVLGRLNEIGRQKNLKGFELAKNIHLTETPFSVENGFLTPTLKLSRYRVKQHFKAIIDQMYEEGELLPVT